MANLSAKDLRIGNWLSGRNDPYMEAVSIDLYGVELRFEGVDEEYGDWYYHYEELHGIPLTKEILVVAGFVNNRGVWSHKDFKTKLNFSYEEYDKFMLLVKCEYSVGKTIRYVHQLQNISFDLYDEELTINLNQLQQA